MNLSEFLKDLDREVGIRASEEGQEQSLGAAFTEHMIDVLTDAAEIDDGIVAIYEARGARASGYSVTEDESTLFLFVSDFIPGGSIRRLGKAEVESHFRRLRGFLEKSVNGLWRQLEESSPAWDMANRIEEVWSDTTDVRLVLLTNAEVRSELPAASYLADVKITHHVWDADRLYKLRSSGRIQEPITVDFNEYLGSPLPVLGPQGSAGEYSAYLALIPGQLLADIYEDHGPRLLELNVRSFLQARNKVNKGIQDTLKNEPSRFLAYNNGISMTAARVEEAELAGGGIGIARVHDLQIVNGGQTTASLNYSRIKNRVDLSGVYVQAKLSVVQDGVRDSIVPKISEFANSQNKVNMADFSANDPFHVAIEKLSRSVWAPGKDGSHRMTRWFYERARGQYADALARERTPAKQKQFRVVNPISQKFTKTDLAKFENTWDQLPHMVSLGAEKNFREFTLRLRGRGSFAPDEAYFQRLVAKGILFRSSEKAIGALKLGGYRSQTVTYSLALILHRTTQRIDLERIWAQQSLSEVLVCEIQAVGALVHERIIKSAGRSNIGEWAKKPACWEEVKAISWLPSSALQGQLIDVSRTGDVSKSALGEVLTDEEKGAMDAVKAVSSSGWFALAKWSKETGVLASWERSLSFSLGKLAAGGRAPSRKQAVQGKRIFDEARRLGFDPNSEMGA